MPPRVSEDIDAWCHRCELLLSHVIMSMNGARPHRVKCKTCREIHAFHAVLPGTRPATAPAAPRRAAAASPGVPGAARRAAKAAASAAAGASELEQRLEGRDLGEATPYSIAFKPAMEQLVAHPKFGVGLVVRRVGSTQVEVLFRDGVKLLACNR